MAPNPPLGLAAYTQPQQAAKDYIAQHKIHQMFSSLLSALMMHRPEDPIAFVQSSLDEVQLRGVENVNWETFVYDLHPYRDPLRLSLIKDNSKFQQEHKKATAETSDTPKYKSEVFKLTENSPSPGTPY